MILQATALAKNFGGIKALQGASISVAAGSITALIGPNGAGKTTMFNAIAGFTPVDRGSIDFGGQDITRPETMADCPPRPIAHLSDAIWFLVDDGMGEPDGRGIRPCYGLAGNGADRGRRACQNSTASIRDSSTAARPPVTR